ncbi:restriction endonuclease [Sphingopyxis sp. CCNWLW253]|uniref:restriction endonuclease n=1 Tax=unclassified Sphingopyxis TaxID=2614943 RepID=UPI003012C991
MKPWKIYERMIAQLLVDGLSTNLAVTVNARIRGAITGVLRQIDVLIEPRHDSDNSQRAIVEAKRRRRAIDVKDVETLLGMMDDVEARFGYLVCPTGHSEAALRRAQDTVRICLVPLDRIADFDPTAWPACRAPRCATGKIFWDGFPQVEMAGVPLALVGNAIDAAAHVGFPQMVGKCETCGAFHASCLTCGDILLVPHADDEDYGHQCSCRSFWFWLGSIERDAHGRRSAELHLVILATVHTVNRRSL